MACYVIDTNCVVDEKQRLLERVAFLLCTNPERKVVNMDMVTFLNGLTHNDDQYILALLVTILIASTIDFLFGWVNARFNSNVVFESGVAL